MLLVDRYVLFVFLRVFLICCVCLSGIYIIGDFVENLSEFIDAADEHGGLATVMAKYYGARIPWFLDIIGRVASLIASVFAVTWLQRNNEMTALMAAGISRWRILRPITLGIICISVLAAINREAVIPQFRETLSQSIRDWGGKRASPITTQVDHMTGITLQGREVMVSERKILEPEFDLPRELTSFGIRLVAETAIHEAENELHAAGFRLSKVKSPANIDSIPSATVREQRVVLTRHDVDWLKPGECFVVSHVTLGQLLRGRRWRQFASTRELIEGLHNPSMRLGADARVSVHARLLQPILDITLFFLGIPVVLSRESRNVFVAAGSCIAIVAAYFLITLGSHGLGMNYLISPVQAAWAPAIIMIPWAVARSGPLRR